MEDPVVMEKPLTPPEEQGGPGTGASVAHSVGAVSRSIGKWRWRGRIFRWRGLNGAGFWDGGGVHGPSSPVNQSLTRVGEGVYPSYTHTPD